VSGAVAWLVRGACSITQRNSNFRDDALVPLSWHQVLSRPFYSEMAIAR
jgi:hypothetical protein